MKFPTWLGIVTGFVLLLGFKALMAQLGLFGVRTYSQVVANPSAWLEHLDQANKPGWYVVQALVFLGAVTAGFLAALASPGSRYVLASALAVLSLLATFFEQFPQPMSTLVVLAWAGAPALGICIGVFATTWLRKRVA